MSATAELQHTLSIPPPSMVVNGTNNNNPIAIAHAALEYLRDSGDPSCLFLRTIIEIISSYTTASSNFNEEILFHCIIGCRQVVLWRWNNTSDYYSTTFQQCLRDYFMIIGNVLQTSRTCRLACYSTSVAFWKRSWNTDTNVNAKQQTSSNDKQRMMEDSLLQSMQQQIASYLSATPSSANITMPLFNDKNDLLQYIESVLLLQNPTQAALYIDTLIGEFVGKSSINYRLPLEFHKNAHRTFEKYTLLKCLQIAIKGIEHIFVQTNSNTSNGNTDIDSTSAIIRVTTNILGWEFGLSAWDAGSIGSVVSSRTVLLRPPVEWRESHIATKEFCTALFTIHESLWNQVITSSSNDSKIQSLTHDIRQLLIQLASMNGAIYESIDHRKLYMVALCDGTLRMLQQVSQLLQQPHTSNEPTIILDSFQLLSRLIANFRLVLLIEVPSLVSILHGLVSIGNQLLQDQVVDCEKANGDYDSMIQYEYRENCIALLLECLVLLCDDPWLLYTGTEETRYQAQLSLATVIGPLYERFITSRIKMISLHEQYVLQSAQGDDDDDAIDEVHDEIEQIDLDEEISSIATIGRLHLRAAIACLASMFQSTIPQLQALWDDNSTYSTVTPAQGALLEAARLLSMHICYLLTDNNDGESPAIPDSILNACQQRQGSEENASSLVTDISSAIQALFIVADNQRQRIAIHPSNPRLSPLLATTFITFLHRWAPAYIYPANYNTSSASFPQNALVREWSNSQNASSALSFCMTLCLNYQCYWPLEKPLQEKVASLLMALAKRSTGPVRSLIIQTPSFVQMVQFHCITAGIRHSLLPNEYEAAVRDKIGGSTDLLNCIPMISGYNRLPYRDKAVILSAILVTCSDASSEVATAMFQQSLEAVHTAFNNFVSVLEGNNISRIKYDDVHAQEMACLCVELFNGVVNASEMSDCDRIPQFITNYLPHLSGLMKHYATDLTVCETLLRFFRDYTAQFIATLNRDQSLALFNAVAEALKSYSHHHCEHRVIVTKKRSHIESTTEEDQSYNDILCAIQLLINLGTKDFLDCYDDNGTGGGLQSNQVTDIIFFGLQQIIPLMTQGLLQYPTLGKQFFELVGFMMDTYPEKVGLLPYPLFDALVDSLLFGMSYHNIEIGKSSLHGLASIAREQLKSNILVSHLTHHPNMIDTWNRRLLKDVVLQSIVTDRIEATGMALLPLVAIDVNRFAAIVQELSNDPALGAGGNVQQQRERLHAAFSKLLQPDTIALANVEGYEGRANRVRFKNNFEEFVNDIHSFLIMI